MIVTSVQIKTAKTQKHLYCLVFTKRNGNFRKKVAVSFFVLFTFLFSFFSFISNCRSQRIDKGEEIKENVALLHKALIMLLCKTSYACNFKRIIVSFCHAITKRNNSLPLKAVVFFSSLLSSHFSLLSQTSVPGEMFPFISKVH